MNDRGGGRSFLENLFLALPSVRDHHAPSSKLYTLLKQIARREIEALFSGHETEPKEFPPFGDLVFPYHKMGVIDSLNLFDLDELIIFSFYWANQKRYRRVLDIGGNIGLHTILLTRCGYEVRTYEPEPHHYDILRRNLALNHCSSVKTFNAAVSSQSGEREFVRVLGNTTGSHLAGSKANPYGDLERFPVKVEGIESLIAWADLVKLDVEGHEKEILQSIPSAQWAYFDALVEVENERNAVSLYEYLTPLGVRLFSQKRNWQRVRTIEDMPTGYREGTLFLTRKDEMPWS